MKFNKQEGRSGAGKTALAIKMTYRAYRTVHSKPQPNVVIYDNVEHPWYADMPNRRFEARLIEGNGSKGVYGSTPEEALGRLGIFENHDPIANAVGKVMAATALLCLIAFYIGVATGGN